MNRPSQRPTQRPNGGTDFTGFGIGAKYIAQSLGGAIRNGDGWMARCPAHTDRDPSLSIDDLKDGRVLVHCFAGCTQEKVIEALQSRNLWPEWPQVYRARVETIDINELRRQARQRFPGGSVANAEEEKSRGRQKGRIVATYDYVDESGKVLFQVVRLDPKDFRQRRPDGKGWIWNLKGIRRVLYRLPRVLKAKVVYVVEGEKDAKTLEGLGRTATCNSGGAGKWRPEYSACLQGKGVVVVPDNDETGRKHAADVARSVYDAGAQWIKVVTLPKGKDATEWVAAGGTKEQLLRLVKETQKYEPPPPPEPDDDQTTIQSISDVRSIFSFANQEVEWDVEDIIVSGGITVIAAESGSGKSTLVSALCHAVSCGEDFAGLATRKRPVVILDRDNPLYVVVDRFRRLGITDSDVFKHWGGWEREKAPEPLSPLVVEWVKACDPKPLIVFDSLVSFSKGDENNNSEMHAIMEQFRELTYMGATVIVLHNRSEKGDANYRGASVIKQDIDVAYTLTNSGVDGKLGTLRLTPFKTRIMVSGISLNYTDAGFVEDETAPRPVRDADRLRDLLIANPGITKTDFVQKAQANKQRRSHARRFLDQGVRTREIKLEWGGKNTHHYHWNGEAPEI